MKCFWIFLFEFAWFFCHHVCMDLKMQELLLCFFSFFTENIGLISGLKGILVSPWNEPFFLEIGFSNINWWALSMPSNLVSYNCACFSSFFLQVLMKELFDYYWKVYSPFSSFFSMSTVFWCSRMFTAVAVFLYVIGGTQCCTCSVMALFVLGMYLWPGETRKMIYFLKWIQILDLVINYRSDINEGIVIHFLFSSVCWWKKLLRLLEWVFLAVC